MKNTGTTEIASTCFPRIFTTRHRAVLGAFATLAVLNLGSGVVLATFTERQTDFETLRRWGREWLLDGLNVYSLELADYPPHALVVLSPLSVLPSWLAVVAWTTLNIFLAVSASHLALHALRTENRGVYSGLPILMFLCWGGFRTLLQFTLLALTFGLLATVLAERRRSWSGICLGIALIKPQVSVPFFLWALFTRRLHSVAVALATAGAGFAVYCLRVPVSPLTVAQDYSETIRLFYLGNPLMVGLSEVRPLVALLTLDHVSVDAIAGAIAAAMLAAICMLGFREGQPRSCLMYSAPPLAALWSLITFYHLTYGFVVLLPLAALLISASDPQTATFRRRLFWTLQAAMMVDVPGVWRRIDPMVGGSELVRTVAIHFDRVLMLVLFTCTWMIAVSARASSER